MSNCIDGILSRCTLNPPADISALDRLERALGLALPEDYRALMSRSNGLEGFVSEGQYVALWPVEEIARLNRDYGVSEFAPGLVLFGSDGGGEAFGFDFRTDPPPVVEVPFCGMSLDDARLRGGTFSEFLKRCQSE